MRLRTNRYRGQMYGDLASMGEKYDTRADRICSILLALSPILQFYKGIYRNAGFTILIILFPYILFRLIKCKSFDKKCLASIVPLLLFQLFKMVDHTIGINKSLYGVFFIVLFFAIASRCINMRYVLECATIISVAAAVLLILQYFCYYILGFHLQLAPTSLFTSSSSGWILGAKTGMYGVRGQRNDFYRPSAFFMEPSHLFIYTFPVLCILLLSPNMNKWRMKMAIWVTIALVLSTSGMGIAVAALVWVVYLAFYNSKDKKNKARMKKLLSKKNLFLLITAVLAVVILYFTVPAVSRVVNRVLIRNSSGSITAIDGRTRLARILTNKMSGMSLLIGVTENVDDIDFNMAGYYATLYKYGWIGIILSYWYYGQYLFKVKDSGFWICVIVLMISFFTAHTHGTFYMLYYVLFLMNALNMAMENDNRQIMSVG